MKYNCLHCFEQAFIFQLSVTIKQGTEPDYHLNVDLAHDIKPDQVVTKVLKTKVS